MHTAFLISLMINNWSAVKKSMSEVIMLYQPHEGCERGGSQVCNCVMKDTMSLFVTIWFSQEY